MIRTGSAFIQHRALITANQTYTGLSDIPEGRLLLVSSSRLSEDDISAEYEHPTVDAELSLIYL